MGEQVELHLLPCCAAGESPGQTNATESWNGTILDKGMPI